MINLFFKGLIIGFAIAAPVGPIGILCIYRSLHDGFKIGLMTGVGAALADGTYGLIAGLGLTFVSAVLIKYQFWIQTLGGLFLLYLGIKLVLTHPQKRSLKAQSDKSLWHACGTTYLLTLANPMTLLSFLAIFAGIGLGTNQSDYIHAVMLVLGIILGSAAWWMLLSGGVAFILHHRMSPFFMRALNIISGTILFAFGIFVLALNFS